ncbi:sialidase family protein [Marinicella rhabdoformis]|uniref:sialidase family protein n=1 Tax=Marinicella rhabdoformis TaxID=2580566 RepID=UPI0015D01BDB|nr:sialidase family protein [Marinicella rhabdoformis]
MSKFALSLLCLYSSMSFADKKAHETWGQGEQFHHMKQLPESKQFSAAPSKNRGIHTSYQVSINNQGDNVLGDAANEPSIAVNPLDPSQMAIGWRQFGSVQSDFREAGSAYSSDGGKTWHKNGPIEAGKFRSDPVLSSDADGTFFYQSLRVVNPNNLNTADFYVDQWRSNDGGKTWTDKTYAYAGDKSWFAIDENNSADRGNIYAAWNVAGNGFYPHTFNYSTDNGQSFHAPITIPMKPIFGTVAVGFDGEVYVAGVDGDLSHLGAGYVLRSNNPIATMFPDFAQITSLDLGGGLRTGAINPVGLLGQLWVATDKSQRHSRGNVYVFASVKPWAHSDPLDVHFQRSTDGGISFEPFKKINSDPSRRNYQWFGTMGVAPNGRIDVTWYDTRDHQTMGQPKRSELYYSYSYDGGLTFAKEQPITPVFWHNRGYPVQQKLGDYIDIVSDNGGAHIAYAATLNGGQDVYYVYARPTLHEENPNFPAHEMDNAWYNPNSPNQGIFTKTLVLNPNSTNPQLQNFEAVFTYTPAGDPIWFTLQNDHPLTGDSITFPVLMPSGEMVDGKPQIRAVGLAVKSRMYDDEGEFIPHRMHYEFDMTETVKNQVMSLTAGTSYFDESFYVNNVFYGTSKSIELEPLVPIDQVRDDFCHPQGQALIADGESSEGRVQFSFQRGDKLNVFGADFSYKKAVDDEGNVSLLLDQNGKVQPVWYTLNSLNEGVSDNGDVDNQIDYSTGGVGFFEITSLSPNIVTVGQEQIRQSHSTGFKVTKPTGEIEQQFILAINSYCELPD